MFSGVAHEFERGNPKFVAGLSEYELAKKSEVSLRMIQLYEQKQNDIRKAQVDYVLRMSKVLGCSMEDLV